MAPGTRQLFAPLVLAVALGLGLGLAPVRTAFADDMAAYRDLNAALARDHVIPGYLRLAEATARLQDAAAGFCADPAAGEETELKAAFHGAMDAWMGVQHIRFGPGQFLMRNERFAFWPDKRNAAGRFLNELLAARDPAALDPATFARSSVAIQGLSALERLLFGADALTLLKVGDAEAAYRCRVVEAIAVNLADMAAGMTAEWRDGERAYARVMETAGPENAFYLDPKEATLDFFKAFHGTLQQVAEIKLTRPLGAALESAKPRRAESWRSARSLDNVRANLLAMQELYAGEAGFTQIVTSLAADDDLDRLLRDAFDSVLATLDSIAQPLSQAVADPQERPKVERLREQVAALQALATTRLAEALALQVGFNAFDGD